MTEEDFDHFYRLSCRILALLESGEYQEADALVSTRQTLLTGQSQLTEQQHQRLSVIYHQEQQRLALLQREKTRTARELGALLNNQRATKRYQQIKKG